MGLQGYLAHKKRPPVIYIYIYTYIYINLYIYIYIYICICIDIDIYTYVHIYLSMYIYIYIDMHLSIYLSISIYLFIHLSSYVSKPEGLDLESHDQRTLGEVEVRVRALVVVLRIQRVETLRLYSAGSIIIPETGVWDSGSHLVVRVEG